MQMNGEYRIPAPRQAVWDALNDPEILKQCIPGCEELTRTDEGGFEAKVTAKVGPVRAKFGGKVELSDIDPPNGYTISGQGTGGAAGFAKGGAKVSLAEDGGETVLSYTVDASVGGKLAQIGSRLDRRHGEEDGGGFLFQIRRTGRRRRARGRRSRSRIGGPLPPPQACRHIFG